MLILIYQVLNQSNVNDGEIYRLGGDFGKNYVVLSLFF